MKDVITCQSADPAPFVVANGAFHVGTSPVLLYKREALWAFVQTQNGPIPHPIL